MKRLILIIALLIVSAQARAEKMITTSQTATIKAPAAKVWEVLIDENNWAKWNPAVKVAGLKKGDGKSPGSEIKFQPVIGSKTGPSLTLTIKTIEAGKVLEFTGKQPGMDILFGFKIMERDQESCEFTSYETITGSGVPLFEKLYGQEGLDQEHKTWADAMKTKAEKK
jgi:hypothetical protein